MRVSFFRLALNSLTSIAMAFATVPAQAAAPAPKWNAENYRHQMEAALSGPMSMADTLYILALNGTSKGSLTLIYSDFQSRTAAMKKKPALKMKHGKLFADGKFTGIEMISYAPATLKFNGVAWTYDSQKTADQNYFTLVKIFESKKSASHVIDWLLPQAEAQVDRVQFMLDGAMAGWYAGMFIGAVASFAACFATAPLCGLAAVAFVMGGGVAGLFAGGAFGNSVYDQAHGLFGPPTMVCDEKGLRIKNWNTYVRSISYDRKTGFSNAEMASIPIGMTKETKEALKAMAENCNNVDDAARILSTMDPAAKTVKEIVSSAKPEPIAPQDAPPASDS